MTDERKVMVIGHGAQLAIASALIDGYGMQVISLDTESPELDLGPIFMSGWDGARSGARRERDSLGFHYNRNRHRVIQLERDPSKTYTVTEAPLTKRQRRRMKGKKA